LDVRLTLQTPAGERVYVEYLGRCDTTKPLPERSMYCAPTFETGASALSWLNRVQAVARGRFVGPVLTYEMYELR
jgi:hypothetical protein